MTSLRPSDFGKFWYGVGKELSDIDSCPEISTLPMRSTGFADNSTVGITEKYETKNEVIGKIDRPKVAVENKGIPPNFKKAKLEDLMDELKIFFEQIQRFTNGMRDFAAGATEELAKVIEYLDGKIAEIDELNESIQAILAIFTIGIPDAGVYVLSIPTTTGGNEAIKEALTSAINGPPNTLDYSVGFMMMGGGPSMEPLQKLLGVKTVGSAAIAQGTA